VRVVDRIEPQADPLDLLRVTATLLCLGAGSRFGVMTAYFPPTVATGSEPLYGVSLAWVSDNLTPREVFP
jgi:hypothetical protein